MDDVCHMRVFAGVHNDKNIGARMIIRQADDLLVPFTISSVDDQDYIVMGTNCMHSIIVDYHVDAQDASHIAMRVSIADTVVHSALHCLPATHAPLVIPLYCTTVYHGKRLNVDGVFFNSLSYADSAHHEDVVFRGRKLSGSQFSFTSTITTVPALMSRYVDADDADSLQSQYAVIEALCPTAKLPKLLSKDEILVLLQKARQIAGIVRTVTTEL